MGTWLELLRSHELTPLQIAAMAAMATFLFAIVVLQAVRARVTIGRRTAAVIAADFRGPASARNERRTRNLLHWAERLLVPGRSTALAELRAQLVQCGYFSPHALTIFFAARLVLAVGLPLLGVFVARYMPPNFPAFAPVAMIGCLAALGIVGPPIFLDYKRSQMRHIYRNAFPEFMDLVVVCVEAGQSMQGALDRVAKEMLRSCPPLGANLHLVNLELRAGRDLQTALAGLAERIGIDEARSLNLLLRQSEELGSSLGDSLRVYSEEMRDKRLLRAEARANALPVKMVIPLGLCMFPVILVVILAPLVLRIARAMV
jgi:tight adherence protein C